MLARVFRHRLVLGRAALRASNGRLDDWHVGRMVAQAARDLRHANPNVTATVLAGGRT